MPQATLGPADPTGLVVVLETASQEETERLAQRIEALPGVLQVLLVYHNIEDIEDTSTEPLSHEG